MSVLFGHRTEIPLVGVSIASATASCDHIFVTDTKIPGTGSHHVLGRRRLRWTMSSVLPREPAPIQRPAPPPSRQGPKNRRIWRYAPEGAVHDLGRASS